jgi:DNA-directed RNA polymerase subunit RPC12/RpoP
MLNFIFIVLAVVLISFIFLGFNIFLRHKNFPEIEIGHNREMRKRGLTCPKCDERQLYRKKRPIPKINPEDLTIDNTPPRQNAEDPDGVYAIK